MFVPQAPYEATNHARALDIRAATPPARSDTSLALGVALAALVGIASTLATYHALRWLEEREAKKTLMTIDDCLAVQGTVAIVSPQGQLSGCITTRLGWNGTK